MPSGRKEIKNDGLKGGFNKNPKNINRTGLNRKTIASVNLDLEAKGYKEATAKDIFSCYLRLVNLPIPELKLMVEDEKQPVMTRVVGKAILSGKGFDIIEKMFDRGIGKPETNTNVKFPEKQTFSIYIGEKRKDATS